VRRTEFVDNRAVDRHYKYSHHKDQSAMLPLVTFAADGAHAKFSAGTSVQASHFDKLCC